MPTPKKAALAVATVAHAMIVLVRMLADKTMELGPGEFGRASAALLVTLLNRDAADSALAIDEALENHDSTDILVGEELVASAKDGALEVSVRVDSSAR